MLLHGDLVTFESKLGLIEYMFEARIGFYQEPDSSDVQEKVKKLYCLAHK